MAFEFTYHVTEEIYEHFQKSSFTKKNNITKVFLKRLKEQFKRALKDVKEDVRTMVQFGIFLQAKFSMTLDIFINFS